MHVSSLQPATKAGRVETPAGGGGRSPIPKILHLIWVNLDTSGKVPELPPSVAARAANMKKHHEAEGWEVGDVTSKQVLVLTLTLAGR